MNLHRRPGWHNWLARETFNLKVEGSSPSSGEFGDFLLLRGGLGWMGVVGVVRRESFWGFRCFLGKCGSG